VVQIALEKGLVVPEDFYTLDDEEFNALMGKLAAKHSALESLAAAMEGSLYVMLDQFHFDEKQFGPLENVSTRLANEAALAEKLSSRLGKKIGENEVIIDVPEKITFESNIRILESSVGADIPGGLGVLDGKAGKSLSAAARIARVFVSRRAATLLQKKQIYDRLLLKEGLI
jgi:hypothetical protein